MHVRNRFLARACAAAAAGVALSTVAVTAASASGGVAARPGAIGRAGLVAGPGGPAIPGAGAASVKNSPFEAGYQTAVTTGSATTVTAMFTVPALSCAPADLGIAPAAAEFVNRNGLLTAAGVAVKCESGKAVYFPALVINNVGQSFRTSPAAAGDVINLSASVTTTATTVTVTDVTKNVTTTLTGAGARPHAAFIGDLGWGSNKGVLLGVPNFGKLKFFNSMINGQALGSTGPQAYQRVNSSGVVQIATGPFSPPGGLAFATYYRHQ
jgi:hypothetical protein